MRRALRRGAASRSRGSPPCATLREARAGGATRRRSRRCSSRPTRAASAASSGSTRSTTSSAHLHAALARVADRRGDRRAFDDGLELNGLAVARGGEVDAADAVRPAAARRGSASASAGSTSTRRRSTATRSSEAERVGRAVGARARAARRDRVPAADRDRRRRGARRRGRGADPRRADGRPRAARGRRRPVEVALRQALGEPVPDELVVPRVLAAARDPVPHRGAGAAADREGAQRRRRSSGCSRSPASCRRTCSCTVGETIRPVRLDGDRRGYVIAVGRDEPRGARARRGGRDACWTWRSR